MHLIEHFIRIIKINKSLINSLKLFSKKNEL